MKIAIFFISLLIGCTVSAQEKLNLTEDAIPDLVKNGNQIVKSERKNIQASEERTGFFKRSLIPKASLQIGQETFKYVTDDYTSGPYYKAGVDINLYNGGRDRLTEETNKVNLGIAQSQKEISLYAQIEEARKTYWNAIYLKYLVEKLEEGLGWIANSKNAAVKRINSGVSTNSDKFEFEIKDVEINQDIERAKLALEKHNQYLKVLVGVESSVELVFGQSLSHDHNWKNLVLHSEDEHSYLFETEKLEIEKKQLQSKLGGSQWLPSIDGYAFLMQNNLRQDFDRPLASDREQTVFGIKATWTLTDFFEGNAKKQSAKALADSQKYRLLFNKRKVENDLHIELKELELLDKLVHDADENIDRSQKFFALISKEYKRGVKTSGDMLLATEKLINSHVRKMAIVRDFHIAKAHVMRKLRR